MLARHGYGVLLYDRRGEGRSEGDPDAWGWDFDKDIRAGVDFLKHRADVDPERIGGLGLSVGGEMMLETAADTRDLAAVVVRRAPARARWARRSTTSPASTRSPPRCPTACATSPNSVLQNRPPPENLLEPDPEDRAAAGLPHPRRRGRRRPPQPRLLPRGRRAEADLGGARAATPRASTQQPEEYERRVTAFFDSALLE